MELLPRMYLNDYLHNIPRMVEIETKILSGFFNARQTRDVGDTYMYLHVIVLYLFIYIVCTLLFILKYIGRYVCTC